MKTINIQRARRHDEAFAGFHVGERFAHRELEQALEGQGYFIALTITAANLVFPGPGGVGVAGEAITAGLPICQVSGLWYKSDSDHATAARRQMQGISISGAAAANQSFSYLPISPAAPAIVGFGAILTVAEHYYVGTTAGQLIPTADLANPAYVVLAGVALTTSNMAMVGYSPLDASGNMVQVP